MGATREQDEKLLTEEEPQQALDELPCSGYNQRGTWDAREEEGWRVGAAYCQHRMGKGSSHVWKSRVNWPSVTVSVTQRAGNQKACGINWFLALG